MLQGETHKTTNFVAPLLTNRCQTQVFFLDLEKITF